MDRKLARQKLDQRLDAIRGTVGPAPHAGWIRAIRDALGMSGSELAQRMGITAQSVAEIEQNEATGSIRLSTLQRAAEALDAEMLYAIVPRHDLHSMVDAQAKEKAARLVTRVAQHSRLEDQALGDTADRAQVDDLAESFVDKRGLWKIEEVQ